MMSTASLNRPMISLQLIVYNDSSMENIAVYIWDRLLETDLLRGKDLLYKVKVRESDKNMASYKGQDCYVQVYYVE